MDEGRRLFQRKSYLGIGDEIGAAALSAKTAAGDDVAARAICEINRLFRRPLGACRRHSHPPPRRQTAGSPQSPQETLSDRIGLTAGKPPRPRSAVKALDRYHIGDA